MPIRVACTNGHKLVAKDSLAGKMKKCPQCNSVILIPDGLDTELFPIDLVEDLGLGGSNNFETDWFSEVLPVVTPTTFVPPQPPQPIKQQARANPNAPSNVRPKVLIFAISGIGLVLALVLVVVISVFSLGGRKGTTQNNQSMAETPVAKPLEPANAMASRSAGENPPSPPTPSMPEPESAFTATRLVNSAIDGDEPALQTQTNSRPNVNSGLKVGKKDWPQWGGSSTRNNTPSGSAIPIELDLKTGKNIRWSMPLGTESYGGIVVANGKVYVGTNNGAAYIKRFPSSIDLGVLLCFDERDGKFLWQHSNEKLPTGRVHDCPNAGICSAPLVDGDRLWYVTNRGHVVCLDTEGFRDEKNDGPFMQEQVSDENEADIVWSFDMIAQLNVSPRNMANCSVTCAGDLLFVNTSHGFADSNASEAAKPAPSFLCLSRATGKVLWTDSSPSGNILQGQWSSPAYGVLGGVPQVIFGGGDGYLYGFLAEGVGGKSKLLWKFDCNPKDSKYVVNSGRGNHIIATPVIYQGLVYVATGQDPQYGEGGGDLWCIDPNKRGDVSPTLVYNAASPEKPIPHKRIQPLVTADGDFEKPNPNSAAVWHNVESEIAESKRYMDRTLSTVAIQDDLLFIPAFSGWLHCLDAKTGDTHWKHDLRSACWGSPLIVEGRVYIGDEDGDLDVFLLSKNKVMLQENNLGSAMYSTPIVANDTLFLSNSNRLWAIQKGAKSKPIK